MEDKTPHFLQGNTYPSWKVAEKLRNLKDHLPGQSKFLYRYAKHFANRLTPSHVEPHNVYWHVFPRKAVSIINELKHETREGPIETVYGYTVPQHLLGHKQESYLYLFDMIPQIFSAITDGVLEQEILKGFERIKSRTKERLDILDENRTEYKTAIDGKIITAENVTFVPHPTTIYSDRFNGSKELPTRIFEEDTAGRYSDQPATHYVPLPRTPGFHPTVVWAVIDKAA